MVCAAVGAPMSWWQTLLCFACIFGVPLYVMVREHVKTLGQVDDTF